MTRVLFVCLGNICRSPAAEGALRALRPHWEVDSAGLSDWHVGDAPYRPMQDCAAAKGLDLSDQRARQVQAADFSAFDYVLAMDRDVLRKLRAMPGGEAARLFGEVCGLGPVDVPDPYYTRDFSGCLQMIQTGLRIFVAQHAPVP